MSTYTIIVEDSSLNTLVQGVLQSLETLPQIKVARKGDAFVVSEPHKASNFQKSANGQAGIAAQFETLFSRWKKETRLASDGDEIIRHPAYKSMVALGKPALPCMLIKLKDDPQFLFDALTAITGEDPVQKAHSGQLKKMAADWLEWGKQNGYALS